MSFLAFSNNLPPATLGGQVVKALGPEVTHLVASHMLQPEAGWALQQRSEGDPTSGPDIAIVNVTWVLRSCAEGRCLPITQVRSLQLHLIDRW